jgi:hypothetical protein
VNSNSPEWDRLCQLAAVGPAPGEYAAAEAFISECERLTSLARNQIRPRTVSPVKAVLMRYPSTAKS